MKKTAGASTLVIVLLIMFFCLSLVAILQSRFLLNLNRNISFADSTLVGYDAESFLGDLLARRPTVPFGPTTFTLPDGTQITYSGTQTSPTTQTISVTTTRQGATSRFEAAVTTISSAYSQAEILLILDATASMLDPSDPNCTSNCTTRYEALRTATINLLNEVLTIDPTHTKFSIGIAVFRNDTKWLKNSSGVDMTPTYNINQLKNAVNFGFTIQAGHTYPPAYDQLFGNTSIGSGLLFANSYWDTHPNPTTKQAEILVTDGLPDTSIPDSRCLSGHLNYQSYYCPNLNYYCQATHIPYSWRCNTDPSGTYVFTGRSNESPTDSCYPPAKNLVRCALAKTDTAVPEILQNGIRPTVVDSYVLTVQKSSDIPSDVKTIFNTYATNYYDLGSADALNTQLQAILNTIYQSTTTITITRQTP